MQLRAPAIFLASRQHGETAIVARVLTQHHGMIAAYIAGGRGRHLRPVAIPGNLVAAELRSKSETQLPFGRLELTQSRGPWLSEPLPAAAIAWVCAITATVLPERQAYPQIYLALSALLDAICNAPSARGWAGALLAYETLLLREMGYGATARYDLPPVAGDFAASLSALTVLREPISRHLLAESRGDVMASRALLMARLARMDG